MILRGYLTTYVNLCWAMGHLISSGVLVSLLNMKTEWSYRIPFAIQWLWPAFLIPACYFAPESPWWFVKRGRFGEAEKALRRLVTDPKNIVNNKNTISMMQHTIEIEKSMNIGGAYSDCFKGPNLRRTEIAVVSWVSLCNIYDERGLTHIGLRRVVKFSLASPYRITLHTFSPWPVSPQVTPLSFLWVSDIFPNVNMRRCWIAGTNGNI